MPGEPAGFRRRSFQTVSYTFFFKIFYVFNFPYFFFFLLPDVGVMCAQLKANVMSRAMSYFCFFRQSNFVVALSYLFISCLHLSSLCSCKHLFASSLVLLPLPVLLLSFLFMIAGRFLQQFFQGF